MSDLETLTALNRDYIHSVQHGDVQRFDEILAEDFLCSNPDGSLVDKNQFLAQTRATGDDQQPHGAGSQSTHSEMSRSSTPAPATPRRMASRGMAAIPMSGRAGAGSGSRYLRM